MRRTTFRTSAIALVGATTLFLGACSAADDPVPDTVNVPESVPIAQDRTQEGPSGQPYKVTGYTAEAEDDLRDENVSCEDVARVVSEICAGNGEFD